MAKGTTKKKMGENPTPPGTMVGVPIQIVQINILDVHIERFEEETGPEQVNFAIRVDQRFQFEENLVSSIVNTTINQVSNSRQLAAISVECKFSVTNLNEIVVREPHLLLPDPMAAFIDNIAISTARGVLFGIMRGTTMQEVVLPLIDMSTRKRVLRENPDGNG